MRIFIPSLGVTFLIPSDKGSHLHFILTFPLRRKKSEEVLVVGITSTKVDPDFTLSISDHPFIKHKSYINYPQAQIISVETIKRNLATADLEKRFILKETADLSVVKYICSGLRESRHSLPIHRDFCEKACRNSKNPTNN